MGLTPPCNSVQDGGRGVYSISRQNSGSWSTTNEKTSGGAHVQYTVMPVRRYWHSDGHQGSEARGGGFLGPFRRRFDGKSTRSSPRALGRGMLRRQVQGQTITANQRARICLRAAGSDCVMKMMVYAGDCFFAAAAPARFGCCPWRLAHRRAPLFLLSQRLRLPFAGCCNVRQTHSVRRLLAACGLRSVPTMSLR